jgi:hypothetical protein
MIGSPTAVDDGFAPAQPKHHPSRWRLARAGIVNVWHYYDTEFAFTGGRMILRGTNGAGKSRALEMLLPYLLDADRRKMDATGSGKVKLEDLMRHGALGQTNRLGYLWLELTRVTDDDQHEYLTVGALVRFSASTGEAKPWYFTTDKRVGLDLPLMDDRRQPLSRDQLGELIGVDLITDKPDIHRDRIGSLVFGLTGQSGRERYAGLLQLLHMLRAPDMGNRIDEGNLPKILSDALPPLSETTLREAGERSRRAQGLPRRTTQAHGGGGTGRRPARCVPQVRREGAVRHGRAVAGGRGEVRAARRRRRGRCRQTRGIACQACEDP